MYTDRYVVNDYYNERRQDLTRTMQDARSDKVAFMMLAGRFLSNVGDRLAAIGRRLQVGQQQPAPALVPVMQRSQRRSYPNG